MAPRLLKKGDATAAEIVRRNHLTLDRIAAKSKLVRGPEKLTARMAQMIALMVLGHPEDSMHTPYGIYDAARAVGYRMKAARHLTRSPVMRAAYEAACLNRSIAGMVPTFDEVRREVEHRDQDRDTRAAAPGYVIRIAKTKTGEPA